jgi:hypothetical protein
MDQFTIAGALKRKGITQREVVEILSAKYNLNISQARFNAYAQQYICGYSPRWTIIRECLEKEFGIVYKPTYWT